jgi:hypothetical protein
MRRIFLFVAALALCSGCSVYNGLIGHPLHVLIQQHQDNERQAEARELGRKMYEDTHPQ